MSGKFSPLASTQRKNFVRTSWGIRTLQVTTTCLGKNSPWTYPVHFETGDRKVTTDKNNPDGKYGLSPWLTCHLFLEPSSLPCPTARRNRLHLSLLPFKMSMTVILFSWTSVICDRTEVEKQWQRTKWRNSGQPRLSWRHSLCPRAFFAMTYFSRIHLIAHAMFSFCVPLLCLNCVCWIKCLCVLSW